MTTASIGDTLDVGDPEPGNVIGVESTCWADYGWGDGVTYVEHAQPDDAEATFLRFGRTYPAPGTGRTEWKFYLGGKTYVDWETVVRRFGPVRVVRIEEPSPGSLVPTCAMCRRERTLRDVNDYNPLQAVTGAPLGWYSGDDGEVCPECMTKTMRGQL